MGQNGVIESGLCTALTTSLVSLAQRTTRGKRSPPGGNVAPRAVTLPPGGQRCSGVERCLPGAPCREIEIRTFSQGRLNSKSLKTFDLASLSR